MAANLYNAIKHLKDTLPNLGEFADIFSHILGGGHALAAILKNSVNTLQTDICGQILKLTDEMKHIAVANATFMTKQAIGLDVSNMPSIQSITQTIVARINRELNECVHKGLEKLYITPRGFVTTSVPNPSGPNRPPTGGARNSKTIKHVSITHRTKTHRRIPVVDKV